jgi:flavodoxin
MKALVTYFSASGVTAALANRMAEAIEAPAYEIRPAVPYTKEDLNWMDKKSRSTVEMQDKSCRPALADTAAPVAEAELIFLGYPVWWYREPSIIDSFLDAYDFRGKRIVLFATSGTSGIGEEAPTRAAALSGAEVLPGKRFPADVSGEELKAWAEACLR